VVLEQEDIASAAPESHDAIDVEAFVEAGSIDPRYFEKPYVLVPAKKAEKGYVLLREALEKTGRIGIARVVIRTREHLCAVMPYGNALLLLMMRYPQELVDFDEYAIPEGAKGDYRITAKELAFSEQLIETMSGEFDPKDYKDEFRARLHKVIDERMKANGVVRRAPEEPEAEEGSATNVVDFMSLLQKSIDRNKRTPAKKSAAKKTAEKPAKAAKGARKATKKAAAKKAPSKAARKRA
jgi:DNA end-binding protein Ku